MTTYSSYRAATRAWWDAQETAAAQWREGIAEAIQHAVEEAARRDGADRLVAVLRLHAPDEEQLECADDLRLLHCNQCMEDHDAARWPCRTFELAAGPDFEVPQPPEVPFSDFWTDPEIVVGIAHFPSLKGYTHLRPGDTVTLRWSDAKALAGALNTESRARMEAMS